MECPQLVKINGQELFPVRNGGIGRRRGKRVLGQTDGSVPLD